MKHPEPPDIPYDILWPGDGPCEPSVRVRVLVQAISSILNAPSASLLSSQCGRLLVEQIAPVPLPLGPAANVERERWYAGVRGMFLDERLIIIPVPGLSADLLHDGKLSGVLVLSRAEHDEPFSKFAAVTPANRRLMRRLGIVLGEQLAARTERRLAMARRRLGAIHSRLVLASDICYQVAREIRDLLFLGGPCCVLRVRGNVVESIASVGAKG